MPTGTMSKRKVENNATSEGSSRQRRRESSSTETLQHETEEPEKREALKRLFGRCCTVDIPNNEERAAVKDSEDEYEESLDENDDPLLDDVPVNMDPEQLGFLVCAQETLRFLYGRGITPENPMFLRLRSRLLQGFNDIAAA